MRDLIGRKWQMFTSVIWYEGYQIGADRAKQELLREIRLGLSERSLKGYKSKHLALGYLHAQEAMLEILHEIESR